MPHAYIVECCDGSYYVGSTWDLERRIGEHNLGLGAAYTRRRRPVRLVWSTEFSRIEEAYLLEKQIQGWGRAKRQALIDGRLEDLPALSRTAKPRATGVSTSSTHDQGSTNEPGSTHDEVSTGSNNDSGSTHDRGASGAGVRRSPGR